MNVLSHAAARRVYDRIGSWQDTQALYEDAATSLLTEQGALRGATSVVELGCGTGRLAERLLGEELPAEATYVGIDVSRTMAGLARERLARFGDRASVQLTEGEIALPVEDETVDRVVSTYVLDLLSEDDIRAFFAEAHRVLVPGGLLALTSATHGTRGRERAMISLATGLHRLYPPLVGGCRAVALEPFLELPTGGWELVFRHVVAPFWIPSEVLIARRCEAR